MITAERIEELKKYPGGASLHEVEEILNLALGALRVLDYTDCTKHGCEGRKCKDCDKLKELITGGNP